MNDCKYAIPDAQEDMMIVYHCTHPEAIKTMQLEHFVDCLCLEMVCQLKVEEIIK